MLDSGVSVAAQGWYSRLTSITTTNTGDILVNGKDMGAGVTCKSAGSCSAIWGLYIDGVAITGSGQALTALPSSTTSEGVVDYGIATNVAPGTHTVQLEVSTDTNVNAVNFGADEQVEAIALKG